MCKEKEKLAMSVIGSTLTRGGTCVYTIIGYEPITEEFVLTYSETNRCMLRFDSSVDKLAKGVWKFKTCTDKDFLVDAIAYVYYEKLSISGWLRENFLDLHDKTVSSMLEYDNYKGIKAHQVRVMVQGLSEYFTNTSDTYQEHNYFTKTYPTKEENIMTKTTNITVTVPTSAYAETNVTTMYGKEVDTSDEQELFALLARIESEQEEFKAINKSAKSTRVANKINALGVARNKVVTMIDALPED